MSAASEYADLLKLIEISGPFLSFPIFREVFPQGLVKDSPDQTRELRELYRAWRASGMIAQTFTGPAQREWLRAVFITLLGWPPERLAEDNAIPQSLTHFVPQHHETLRPDAVLLEDGKPRLLIAILPPAQQPDRRPPSTTWNASSATRMAELLRATRVPLGLVTNGERFTLVYAEPDQPTGFADFRAELWFDERLTLRAFRDFLSSDGAPVDCQSELSGPNRRVPPRGQTMAVGGGTHGGGGSQRRAGAARDGTRMDWTSHGRSSCETH